MFFAFTESKYRKFRVLKLLYPQQKERKRESSGWNISDDDLEEYMKMKPVPRKAESDEGFSFKNTGLYLGAASLLAAGVTVAFVKAKFFS